MIFINFGIFVNLTKITLASEGLAYSYGAIPIYRGVQVEKFRVILIFILINPLSTPNEWWHATFEEIIT